MALCYGLVYAGVAARGQWTYQRGKALAIPFAPARAIIVEVWPLALLAERYNPYSRAFLYFDPDSRDARWISIWYDDRAAGTRKRLAVVTLPRWPLTVSATVVWLLLAMALIPRRTTHSTSS